MVAEVVRTRILEALGVILEPIVLLLLKNGVTWAEFSRLAKETFVDVATRRFGIRGRPTNVSRAAILTGLDRREVSRIRHRREPSAEPRALCKPTQVLDGWFRDVEFLDSTGKPADLDIEGPTGSFAALARRYAPSIPHVAMIKQLRSVGAVEQLADGRLSVLKRAYVPRTLSEDHIALWGSVLHDIGTTWEYNLMRDASQRTRFERRAVNIRVDPRALEEFRSFLEAEGQVFLERVDDWLSAHEAGEIDPSTTNGIRLGVGVYQIGEVPVTARGAK